MTTTAATTDASIRRDLRAIADLWPLLLDPANGSHATSSDPSKPPVSEGALSLRREIPEILTSWVRLVMDDYDADPTGIDTHDAASITHWLTPWAEHLATHEAADDLAQELTDMIARMDACVYGARTTRVETDEPCPVIEDGLPCPGALTIIARYDDTDRTEVHCTVARHRHTWTAAGGVGSGFGDLGHLLRPGGVALVTVAEASALTDVPRSTIKSWLRREHLTRYPGPRDGDVLVDYHEVCRTATRDLANAS